MPRTYPRKYRKVARGQGQIFDEPRTERLNAKFTATAMRMLHAKAELVGVPVTVLLELLIRRDESIQDLVKLRETARQLGFDMDAQTKDRSSKHQKSSKQ